MKKLLRGLLINVPIIIVSGYFYLFSILWTSGFTFDTETPMSFENVIIFQTAVDFRFRMFLYLILFTVLYNIVISIILDKIKTKDKIN